MTTRVAIIGGGWYGCHLALSMLALGFEVRLFEQHSRLLHEASGNNQFRLHLGFHYARHHATRVQSRDGFMRFMERYAGLSRPVAQNIYAVPHGDSLIDWQTYKLIMTSTGLSYKEVATTAVQLKNMEGIMLVDERVLLTERARQYFMNSIGAALVLEHRVESIINHSDYVEVDGQRFEFIVDATWGQEGSLPIPILYEPTVLLYYEGAADLPAVTMVDGPLCSIYPTEDPTIYTLSSVPFTPVGQFHSVAEARLVRSSIDNIVVRQKVDQMEDQIQKYIPNFKDQFKFLGPQIAMKTKPIGRFDDRSCGVYRHGRLFSVMSGKIDTIFFAAERVLNFIQIASNKPIPSGASHLRQDIMERRPVADSEVAVKAAQQSI